MLTKSGINRIIARDWLFFNYDPDSIVPVTNKLEKTGEMADFTARADFTDFTDWRRSAMAYLFWSIFVKHLV